MTREKLSERAELGLRHVAAIELGEKNPSVDTLIRFVSAALPLRLIGYSIQRHIQATVIWSLYLGYPRHAHPNRGR